mmetsp:Transcript_4277/g.10413  ORF Transcript_4277/g.10413 Transcript_4277/m.10413 type:complete len:204 (-) Transcript_4277:35-646(-)
MVRALRSCTMSVTFTVTPASFVMCTVSRCDSACNGTSPRRSLSLISNSTSSVSVASAVGSVPDTLVRMRNKWRSERRRGNRSSVPFTSTRSPSRDVRASKPAASMRSDCHASAVALVSSKPDSRKLLYTSNTLSCGMSASSACGRLPRSELSLMRTSVTTLSSLSHTKYGVGTGQWSASREAPRVAARLRQALQRAVLVVAAR